MNSPELAAILLAGGRYRVGPLVGAYLDTLHRGGELHAPDPGASFTMLYGLVSEDMQIRVLLDEDAPSTNVINIHAATAVDRFLALSTPRK